MLGNGELIQQAEAAGYEVLLNRTKISGISRTFQAGPFASWFWAIRKWPLVRLHLDRIAAAVNTCTPGSYAEVDI